MSIFIQGKTEELPNSVGKYLNTQPAQERASQLRVAGFLKMTKQLLPITMVSVNSEGSSEEEGLKGVLENEIRRGECQGQRPCKGRLGWSREKSP